MQVEFGAVQSLLQLVAEEGIEALELETAQFCINIRRQPAGAGAMVPPAVAAGVDGDAAAAPDRATQAGGAGGVKVCAPVDGVFYRAASAGGAPLCEAGMHVVRGDALGIIEVMKIMNQIMADCDGHVAEVLVADGEAVRQGQPLFILAEG